MTRQHWIGGPDQPLTRVAIEVTAKRATKPTLLFVGECRSLTAKRKNWTWKDGHLAAKPLFEALAAMGVDPLAHEYLNLWTDAIVPTVTRWTMTQLKVKHAAGYVLVALGQRVSKELAKRMIEHVAIVHPAARGKIRKSETYRAHVKEKLGKVVSP